MPDKTPVKLIKLYEKLSDLTHPECKTVCRVPYSCCSAEYCEFTMHFAAQRGVELKPVGFTPRLPLMGPTGCVAPPHLRPMCTAHTCDILAYGYKKDDPGGKWSEKYYDLRGQIEEIELEITTRQIR